MHDSDRNLLLGIFAVQLRFISREDLVAGMSSWVTQKDKPLAAILLEQGRLSTQQAQELEARVAAYLHEHGGDEAEGLRAIAAGTTIASVLTPIDDDDVRASLSKIYSEPQTQSYQPPPVPPGMRYRKLDPDPIASGGQGDVYLAEDLELFRHVALKELRSDFADSAEFRLKFVLEAEITAGLDHPGVVPVHGLGNYADDRPYYAMRFLPGDNLEDAIKRFHAADRPSQDPGERNLTLRQLLRHFINVCNTIAYAHSRDVLHRDIKPKNIMLGKFGETIVVDWGLAKTGVSTKAGASLAAEAPLNPRSQAEFEATLQGAFKGTHGFAAPEQEQGRIDLLSPRSDVFSLGSTLCVLLTGAHPFRGEDRPDLLKKYKKGEFTSPLKVKPDTPRPLDAICRKALAYEPKDRYQSALALAADVEHWLADERVSAYSEPWTAQAGRWARRHRTAVVGTAVCLVTAVVGLSIGSGLLWAEQRETEKQRQVAVAQEKKTAAQKQIAEKNLDLAVAQEKKTAEQKRIAEENYVKARDQLFESISLIENSEVDYASMPTLHDKRKDMLTKAARSCQEFLTEKKDDIALQERSAQIFRFAANFNRLTNQTGDAEAQYKDSISLREKLVAGTFANDPNYHLQLALTLKDYANLQINRCRFAEAAKNLARSLEITEDMIKKDKRAQPRPAFSRMKASALHHLAAIGYAKGRPNMDAVIQTIDIYRELSKGAASHPYDWMMLAITLNSKAIIERETGKLKEAGKTHREANDIIDDLKAKRPKFVSFPDILHVRALCKVEQAKSWARDTQWLELAEGTIGGSIKLDGPNKLGGSIKQWEEDLVKHYPNIPTYQEELASAYLTRGEIREARASLAQKSGDAKEEMELTKKAKEDFARACRDFVKLTDRYRDLPALRGELGKAYAGMWRVAKKLGEKDSAEWLKKARSELEQALEQAPEHAEFRRALAAVK